MRTTSYYVANGMGDSIEQPTEKQMREFIDAIDASDEEHGAAWLSNEHGASLEWNGDGRLVFTTSDSPPRHLHGVSRDRAVALWLALARGEHDEVEGSGWRPGNGFVMTAERAAEIAEWRRQEDRHFYDLLGTERSDVKCRAVGCTRGAIEHSVECRVHHFESIKGRACPFAD